MCPPLNFNLTLRDDREAVPLKIGTLERDGDLLWFGQRYPAFIVGLDSVKINWRDKLKDW